MTARRAGTSAAVLTVLAVGLMLVMIMFAARTGPQRIVHGTLRDPSIRGVDPSFTPPTLPSGCGGASAGTHPRQRVPQCNQQGLFHGSAFLHAIGFAIRLAVVACVLWLIYRLIRRAIGAFVNRRRPPPPPEDVEFDVLDDPTRLAEEMRQDAGSQLDLLLGGSPRNAIVACWDRFEEQAEHVNAARKPWETSSEFTLRLLDAVSADAAAVARLEQLYREARFSTHEIDESRRESALEALEAIHASLGVRGVRG